jgi:hypothetical protein
MKQNGGWSKIEDVHNYNFRTAVEDFKEKNLLFALVCSSVLGSLFFCS